MRVRAKGGSVTPWKDIIVWNCNFLVSNIVAQPRLRKIVSFNCCRQIIQLEETPCTIVEYPKTIRLYHFCLVYRWPIVYIHTRGFLERTPSMVGRKSKSMSVSLLPQLALKNLLMPYRAPISMLLEGPPVPIPFLISVGHKHQKPPYYSKYACIYVSQ